MLVFCFWLSKNNWIGILCKSEASHATNSGYGIGLTAPLGKLVNGMYWSLYGTGVGAHLDFSPVSNKWYHTAISSDGNTLRCFVNGALLYSSPYNGNNISNDYPLTIGGQSKDFW